jgi:hypothetical protein
MDNVRFGPALLTKTNLSAWAVSTVRYVISTYNQFTYDRPWWAGISFAFSILEVNTGIICACVPTFSPLLSKLPSFRAPSLGHNFTTNWTFRTPWTVPTRHYSPEKEAELSWGAVNYHGHLTSQDNNTLLARDGSLGSREGSEGIEVTPAVSTEMATFSPVYDHDDMPPYDLLGIQALSTIERDKI